MREGFGSGSLFSRNLVERERKKGVHVRGERPILGIGLFVLRGSTEREGRVGERRARARQSAEARGERSVGAKSRSARERESRRAR